MTPAKSTRQPEHNVPPPDDELEPETPLTEPASNTTDSDLITEYPDRSEWEADVSRRALEEIHKRKHPGRSSPTK